MTALELLACGALIGCSAFLSASEVALFSLSRFQLRGLKDRFKPALRRIKKLQSDAGGVLLTILVLNEIVNVSLSTLITGIIDRWFRGESTSWLIKTLVGVLLTTPVLLILCEVTPKTIGARANTIVAPLVAAPLHFLYGLMKPVRIFARKIIRIGAEDQGRSPDDKGPPLREEEFLVMVEEGLREGAIQRSELDLIRNVFAMEETQAHELMTPIARVPTLQEGLSVNQAIEQFRQIRMARIPVLSKNRKSVVGILYLKDLLRARLNPALGSSPVSELMHKTLFVPRQMPINRLFKRFRQSQTHIAMVEDATGEPIGVITLDQILDDLMEEMLVENHSGGAIR